VAVNNASVYDPYWSVQPFVIGLLIGIKCGFNLYSLILFIAVTIWAVRLTINWMFEFKNLTYQDWRYIHLKNTTGKFYGIINFVGIHLVPTLVVYTCTLPLVYSIINKPTLNYFSLIFIAVCLLAVVLQLVADSQMREYRKTKPTVFIRVGLWKYSRHPNYLGEILMWWGVGLATLISAPSAWNLLLGAILNTLLFIFVSIPLQDSRQSKKPGFNEYKKQTHALLPIYKKA
jgi:steroid 5-alpha reductase family enzyme